MRREGSGKSITRDWPLLLLVGGRKRGKEAESVCRVSSTHLVERGRFACVNLKYNFWNMPNWVQIATRGE